MYCRTKNISMENDEFKKNSLNITSFNNSMK